MSVTLKEFLEECHTLGLLRIIVTSGGAVLEVRGVLEKLFYAELPKGRYANMHTEGFEFHLNMDKIASVKFETGEAKRGNFTTYAIRLLDNADEAQMSLFLQWGKPGEYATGQVAAWESLKGKYAPDDQPWLPEPLT
jgi:putative heme iron utilization protein